MLAAALMKNAEDDRASEGFLYAIDIDRDAGYLFRPPYTAFGKILYGDSMAMIHTIPEKIDMFIHDSYHTPPHELAEFEAVLPKLADDALVLSDNSHCTSVLWEFARRTGRQFLYFHEQPSQHWYPGAGIGVAF